MVSSRKIIAFCLCIFATTLGHSLVDAYYHSGGQNNGLAELLAAGLVTLLIRDGGRGLLGGGGSRSAGYETQGRHNYVQDTDFVGLGHNIPLQDFGSEFEIFDYVPSFGGHRYNLGDIENSYPFNALDLIPDIEDAALGQDLGLEEKLYSRTRAVVNNDVDKVVEDLRRKALQRQVKQIKNEENSDESKEERDRKRA